MVVEYKRDLHHNYMILNEVDNSDMEEYCLKILKFQKIDGILHMEQRTIDNQVSFYYDITAKQSMKNLYDKTTLSCIKVKRLLTRMIDTIENAYEYLLMEDDFILSPEHVYLDVTGMPYLCYLSGYRKNIKEQMQCFIEYIMNKVDYNDKEAVLLVYSLYAACKEEGYTLDHLLELLNNQLTEVDQEYENNDLDRTQYYKQTFITEDKKNPMKMAKNEDISEVTQTETIGQRIPVMKERLVNEEEILHYPLKTYIYTGGCIIGGIALLGFGFVSKIAYNTYGNQINYGKLFAMLLLIFCIEGYLIKKIWDKKNRHSRLVSTREYVNPLKEFYNNNIPKVTPLKDKILAKNSSNEENIQGRGSSEVRYYDYEKPKIKNKKVDDNLHSINSFREKDTIGNNNIMVKNYTKVKNGLMVDENNNVISNINVNDLNILNNKEQVKEKNKVRDNRMTNNYVKNNIIDKNIVKDKNRIKEKVNIKEIDSIRTIQNFKGQENNYGNDNISKKNNKLNNIKYNTKNDTRINDRDVRSLNDKILIKNYIDEEDEQIDNIDYSQPTCLLNKMIPNQFVEFQQEMNENQTALLAEDVSFKPQETYINADTHMKEESFIKQESKQKTLILKPINDITFESIVITEFPFFIGKLKQNVDFCLEKDVISRYHAKISKEQDQYYITDLNSKNGTFVNNELINTYQSKEIRVGDEISFADIKYSLVANM